MNAPMLYDVALSSGVFPGVTARRLRNVVVECFAPRYLVDSGAPARHLQMLLDRLPMPQIAELMFLFTARAVYWQTLFETSTGRSTRLALPLSMLRTLVTSFNERWTMSA